MNRIVTLLIALAALLASAGCQRKDLMEPHNHYNLYIKAKFDDHGLSQLMSNKSRYAKPGEPASTKYILYEKNSQKVAYKGSFDGLQGGMYVQEGVYDLLVYTTDFNELDANFFRGMDKKETTETYTRQNVKEETRAGVIEMYMVEPDPTFSVLHENVVVFQGEEDNVVEVEFVQKSFKYYLTIKATGLHNIHSATMQIEGMYTTAFLTNEDHRMDESGTQSVEMDIHYDTDPSEEVDNGYIYGEFWSFGPNQREDIVNSITLYFTNGDVIKMKLNDLTDQIKQLTRGGEIKVDQILEIRGPAGGFQPGVEDWNETNVDLVS